MDYPRVVSRLSIIEPFVAGKEVLDIGCVDSRPGNVRKYESTGLHRFVKQHAGSLLGVDIDREGAEEMVNKGYNVVCENAETMRLDRQFDCIVAGEIIEHLNNAGSFIETMREHLKDDGVLIITTPNAFCIANFFRILRRNRVKVHPEHTCWYDPVTLNQLISRYNMRIETLYFSNKEKWYRKRYFYKIFRYQFPKMLTWLWPYFSGSLVAIVRKQNADVQSAAAEERRPADVAAA